MLPLVVGLLRVKIEKELLKIRAVRGNPSGAGFSQGQYCAPTLRFPAAVNQRPYRVGDNQYHFAKHLYYHGGWTLDKPLPPGGAVLLPLVVGVIRVKAEEKLLKLRAVRGNPSVAGFS